MDGPACQNLPDAHEKVRRGGNGGRPQMPPFRLCSRPERQGGGRLIPSGSVYDGRVYSGRSRAGTFLPAEPEKDFPLRQPTKTSRQSEALQKTSEKL